MKAVPWTPVAPKTTTVLLGLADMLADMAAMGQVWACK
jgi:hypothetical protein